VEVVGGGVGHADVWQAQFIDVWVACDVLSRHRRAMVIWPGQIRLRNGSSGAWTHRSIVRDGFEGVLGRQRNEGGIGWNLERLPARPCSGAALLAV
jgi:hypothetical protein